jgi:hypothetical protein
MKTLKDAALEGWEVCNRCQLVFCNECKKANEEEEICPGSVYTTKHKSNFGLLPVEQIIETANSIEKQPKESKYISKIFFEDERKKIEVLRKNKKKKDPADFSIVRFREEQWRKFGTVLVKRKDGKFLTWGQIE